MLKLRNPAAHVESGMPSRRAASEKLLASTTLAKTTNALRSVMAPSRLSKFGNLIPDFAG
jgi:hypothetical protein